MTTWADEKAFADSCDIEGAMTASFWPMKMKAGIERGVRPLMRPMMPWWVVGRYPQNIIAVWNVPAGTCAK